MTEKLLDGKKNGCAMLLVGILILIAAVALFGFGVFFCDRMDDMGRSVLPGVLLIILSVCVLVAGIIFLCGLTVLRPQEAVVFTLFGDYYGTLKGEGFYYVNPFCSGFNPAAGTKLRQSGDVGGEEKDAVAGKTVDA